MKTSKTGTPTVETYQDKQLGISRSARALFDYKYPDCPDEPTLFKLRSSLKLQPGERLRTRR